MRRSRGRSRGSPGARDRASVKSRPIAAFETELDAEADDPIDLRAQHLPRQPVLGDPDRHHAAGHRHRLEHRDRIPKTGEVVRGRHAGRAAADDRHALGSTRAGGSIGGSFPCSAANRFSVRMEIGSSSTPRRQATSQGAVQIQPQTDGNGLTSAATA